MQDTKIYDYMIRAGTLVCSYADKQVTLPIIIGMTPQLKKGEMAAHCVLSSENHGLRAIVFLDNDTGLSVRIESISLDTTIRLDNTSSFFCNGYQSSSSSGHSNISAGLKSPGPFCSRFRKNAGDYSFSDYSKNRAHSWTYTYFDSPLGYTLLASLDESIAFTRIDFIKNENKKFAEVKISKDCEGLHYGPVSRVSGAGTGSMKILDFFMITGEENKCWDEYFSLFYSLKSGTDIYNRSKPALAWDSSYAMLDSVNEETLESIAYEYMKSQIPLDYFIIGGGYETTFGDWTSSHDGFPASMRRMADTIKEAGFKPGIAFSPFVCTSSSLLFRERRELIVKNKKEKPLCIGKSRDLGGKLYILDIFNPEGERYIERCMRVFTKEWGMEIIRADMLYAASLNSGVHTQRTRAQAMSKAVRILRKYSFGAKIIASAVPLGSVFGSVEYCTVAPDLSSSWNGSLRPGCGKYYRERESTYSAIKTSIARRHLDSRAFASDMGSFTLRKYRSKMSRSEKLTLFSVCNIFSSLITGSDSLSAYDAQTLSAFRQAVSDHPARRYDKKILEVSPAEDGLSVKYILYGEEETVKIKLIQGLSLY